MFKSIFVRFKWLIMLATLLSIAGAVSGVIMLKLVTTQLSAIGEGIEAKTEDFVLFVLAVSAVLLFGLFSRYLLAKLSASVVYEFRDALTKRLLSTSYAMIEQMGGHRILSAMKTDAAKLSDGLLLLPSFIYSFFTVVLCLVYMVYTSWQLFSVVFVLMSSIVFIARFFLKYGLFHFVKLRRNEDELFAGLRTLVDGVKELTVNANRRRFIYRQILEPNFKEIRGRSIKVSLIFNMLNSMASTLVFFVIGIIVFGTSIYFPEISLQVIVTFVLAILYMINPLETVVSALGRLSDFTASYRNIEGLPLADADDFEQKIALNRHVVKSHPWQRLTVKQIAFKYGAQNKDDYQFHIGPLDAVFHRGEVIFLTGGNGSGKSTFAKLLVGLYQPDSGTIALDDKVVTQAIAVEDYQQLYSTIFSDYFLFEHVLDEAGELESDAVIAKHLQHLELDHRVTSTDGKLSSVTMSQGQRKRLALLMSMLENTPICLYDEWAADQDPRFREIFYTQIIPELKRQNKLVLVISHDDRYFHLADQLIKFEGGEIIENTRPQSQLADSADALPV